MNDHSIPDRDPDLDDTDPIRRTGERVGPARAIDPGSPRSGWSNLPRWVRWPLIALAVFTVVGVLLPDEPAGDTAAADPDPASVEAQAADDGPELTDQQRERRELRQTYTRRDARVCAAYATALAEFVVTEDGTTTRDDMLTAAARMRSLADRADNVDVAYSIEGIANDLDGMLTDGVTSQSQDALQGNIVAATGWCDEARTAYPGAYRNAGGQ